MAVSHIIFLLVAAICHGHADHWLGARVVKTNMTEFMQDESIMAANEGVIKYTEYGDIAKHVQTHFRTVYGGQWHCIIAPVAIQLGNTLLEGVDQFIEFDFGEIKVILSLKSSETDNQSAEDNFEVKVTNKMSADMTNAAVDKAKEAVNTYKQWKDMAKHVGDHFDNQYGRKWICFAGKSIPLEGAVSTDSEYLLFKVNSVDFLLLRTDQEVTSSGTRGSIGGFRSSRSGDDTRSRSGTLVPPGGFRPSRSGANLPDRSGTRVSTGGFRSGSRAEGGSGFRSGRNR
ncbi:hypothetical protein HDE_13927 [Halotydeus destructor]|nr:hypothetical protein HDE_13927 [Halotydeus destructor]